MSKDVLQDGYTVGDQQEGAVQVQEGASSAVLQHAAPDPYLEALRQEQLRERQNKKKHKRRMKIIKTVSAIFSVLLVIGGGVFGIYKLLNPPAAEPQIETTFVMRAPMTTVVYGSGMTKPLDRAAITVKAAGKVMEMYVSEGDEVTEGQILYKIDSSELTNSINDSRKKLTEAQKDLSEIVKKIDSLNIKAPFYGKAMDVKIKDGDVLTEGAEVATLVDDSKMKLKLYFSYAFESDIEKGMSAQISIPQTMSQVTGRVSAIEKVRRITPEGTVLFEVVIEIDNPGALSKGMAATASIKGNGLTITPFEAGALENVREEKITSKAGGKVIDLKIKDFHEYKSGELLCALEGDSYDDQIRSAQKTMEDAQKEVDSYQEQYDSFEAKAPINGKVTSLTLSQGAKVAAGDEVIVIEDLSKILVEARIDQLDIGNVTNGMQVMINQDTREGQLTYSGKITKIASEPKNENGYSYFPANIELEGAQDLTGGMSLWFSINISNKEDCLVVPIQCVRDSADGRFLFIRGEMPEGTNLPDGITEDMLPEGFYPVKVETGISDQANIEIVSGVDENAEVYVQTSMNPEDMGGMGGMGRGVMMMG